MKIQHTASLSAAIKARPLAHAISTITLLTLAVVLMIGHYNDNDNVTSLRGALQNIIAPVVNTLSQPANALKHVGYKVQEVKQLHADNVLLRRENETLLKWQSVAHQLERENSELRSLLGLPSPLSIDHITAYVVNSTHNPLHHTLWIRHNGDARIAKHQAVISEHGLVGYVLYTHGESAQILLMTDRQFRIPVEHETSGSRAILAGAQRKGAAQLVHVESNATFAPGDRIISTIHAPFGQAIAVGTVSEVIDGTPYITPFSDVSDMHHVSIVVPEHAITSPQKTISGTP